MLKRKIGKIVSCKMSKTAIVLVTRFKSHALYGKKYRVSKRFPAHNPENGYKIGEMVEIEESRPISKTKHWKIVGKAKRSAR